MPLSLDAAESALQQAMLASDVPALDSLLHPDAIFVGTDGGEVTKAADLEAHRTGALRLTAMNELSRSVTELDGAGISRTLLQLKGSAGGTDLEVTMVYTRTWVRHAGTWQVIQAQGSLVQ
jgi:ketosteroid isomerase-like protein